MDRHQYKNPPIEEALCQFSFASAAEWDITSPARLMDAFRPSYSGMPEQQKKVDFTVGPGSLNEPSVSMKTSNARIHFPDADRQRLVGVSPMLLSVHVLRPYGGWADFRTRITAAIEAYQTVCKSPSVAKINFRYINKIAIPITSPIPHLNLEEFFRCVPPEVSGLPSRIMSFVHRVEHAFDDDVRLVVTLASIEPSKEMGDGDNHPEFLLDCEVIWMTEEPIELNRTMQIVEVLHEREGASFEAIITDKLREVFDAE